MNWSIFTIADIIIALLLIGGAITGAQKGFLRSATDCVLTILAIIVSFFLKNPISVLMYTNLPFFNFKGIYEGISVLNIVIYEVLAYLLVLSVLLSVVRQIVKVSGIIERIIDATIVLALPSKLLGLIFCVLESYLFIFVIVFGLNQFPGTIKYVDNSVIGNFMLENTPIISGYVNDGFKYVHEISDIVLEYKEDPNAEEANQKAFEIMLKDKVLTTDNAKKLIEKKKLEIKDADKIIEKYQGAKE